MSRPKEQLLEALPRKGERKSCGCGRRMPGEPRVEVGSGGGPSFSGVLFTLILSKLEIDDEEVMDEVSKKMLSMGIEDQLKKSIFLGSLPLHCLPFDFL